MSSLSDPWEGRPLPLVDVDSAPFFEAAARGILVLQQCVDTGRFQHYPRARSIYTGGDVRWADASGKGRIYSFSIVRQNYAVPAFQAFVPYVVALIDLEEGVRITGNVIGGDVERVHIGMALEIFFRNVDIQGGLHLPFWRPAAAVSGAA